MRAVRFGWWIGAFVFAATGCSNGVALKTVATGLDQPVLVTGLPGDAGRLVAAERAGLLKTIDVESGSATIAMDIAGRVDTWGNRGVMGFAFDPDFETNRLYYVLYNHAPGPVSAESTKIRIARFTAQSKNPFVGDADTEQILLEFEGYTGEHNGGSLAFSPIDGYLYIFTGDATCCHDPFSLAQDLTVLNGKILRIDVGPQKDGELYGIPPGNPKFNAPDALPEIWAFGVRNPFRASFDSETGDLYFADVGEKAFEEINFQPANSQGGENYGWPVFEGTTCNPNAASEADCIALTPEVTFPLIPLAYGDSKSVTGGVVYRGAAIPQQRGTYFFGDWVLGTLWSARVDQGVASPLTDWTAQVDPDGAFLRQLVAFGEGADRELYAVTYTGSVYQLTAASL
jgi:glucose/arabinose dehydrogenase